MPPKCVKFSLPILLKGDRIKVHFRNLTTMTDKVWQGTCVNVEPNPEGTVSCHPIQKASKSLLPLPGSKQPKSRS